MSGQEHARKHHVVIIGGGFGGLYAAKSLARSPVKITVVDKRNFHLFQPLLYQVATGALSPGDISSPIRAVLRRSKNVSVIQAEVTDLDPAARKISLRDGELSYDTLIVATGVHHHYFGREDWERWAPGLKTIEDALGIRAKVLEAFEKAEREPDPARQKEWLTFVIVGGGPTGVELAGALGEMANYTLKRDFRRIHPEHSKIILVEHHERLLPTFPEKLSREAGSALRRLGVTVRNKTKVTEIGDGTITLSLDGKTEELRARTVLWAAGVKASSMGRVLGEKTGAQLDRVGRVTVEPDLSLKSYPNIFAIGDLAYFPHQTGEALPGTAPVAIQQGRYVAKLINARLSGKSLKPFQYHNRGDLAVIGRNAAVADFGRVRFGGFMAWLIWVFIHIANLIEFDNKLLVMVQWAVHYFTRKRGARLITEKQGSTPPADG